ncbi:MAG: hypothetical protein AB8C84_11150 [Oligoflexales bacterium]
MLIRFFLILMMLVDSSRALSCASCGSGAGNPLVFSPAENHKVYLGLGSDRGFENITSGGRVSSNSNLDQRIRSEFSYGYRMTDKLIAAFNLRYQRHNLGNRSKLGFADPTLMARYDLLMPSLAQPFKPQIQMIMGYLLPLGLASFESQDPNLLDAMGGGFHSFYLGVDLWWGMNQWIYGGNVLFQTSLPEEYHGLKMTPGNAFSFTLTGGYRVGKTKVVFGMNRKQKMEKVQNGVSIAMSSSLQHDGFLTFEVPVDLMSEFRVTFVQTSLYGMKQRMATRSQSLTLGWIHNFAN